VQAIPAFLSGILGLLAASTAAAGGQTAVGSPPASAADTPAASAEALPEVTVQANEPRYVAPTRRDQIGRIWAPVLINGKGPFRLVLDTGASHSALIATTAQKLGLAPDAVPTRLFGVTGTAIVPSIHVDSMEVGDILINPTTLPIVADVFGGAEGVLGREALPDKRIYADFKHDRLVIARSHREPAPIGFMTIHLKLTNMGLLALDTRIGGVPAKAIIDTGAQTSVGNLALRNALMRHPPKDARVAEIIGVTLDVQRGDNLPSPPLELGQLKLKGLTVTFGDMSLFEHWGLTHEPVLLIGMDVLGLLDVLVIDYRMHEMQVRLREASVGPSCVPAGGGVNRCEF
jgi:predicted aspartyl protease